jgi:hypothetical protein
MNGKRLGIIVVAVLGSLILLAALGSAMFMMFKSDDTAPVTVESQVVTMESSTKSSEREISTKDPLMEEMQQSLEITNKFLETFYTYKRIGDNEEALLKLATPGLQNQLKRDMSKQKQNVNSQNFANNKLVESGVHYERLNDRQFSIYADVKYAFDILDGSEKVIQKEQESTALVKLFGERQTTSSPYLIRELTFVTVIPND